MNQPPTRRVDIEEAIHQAEGLARRFLAAEIQHAGLEATITRSFQACMEARAKLTAAVKALTYDQTRGAGAPGRETAIVLGGRAYWVEGHTGYPQLEWRDLGPITEDNEHLDIAEPEDN